MTEKPADRYVIRQDAPESWAVVDTRISPHRENRIIFRVSETRARQIADHLNIMVPDKRTAAS